MRAYELMIIHDGGLDDASVQDAVKAARAGIESAGGQIHKVDFWGRRKFAYEINKKTEGYYSVYEILAEGGALDGFERTLRLADTVVRHKLIRLPDAEATRRGMFGEDDSEE